MTIGDDVNRIEPVVESVEPGDLPTSGPMDISSFAARRTNAATAPPSYRSSRQATLPPYRAETPSPPPPTPPLAPIGTPPLALTPSPPSTHPHWTTCMYLALLLIFSAQVLAFVLCTDGSKKLTRSPGSAARSPGLAVVLAATAVEMAGVWILAPIAHRIANGAVLAMVYASTAAELVATSGFLFHCVTRDRRADLCHEAFVASKHDCDDGLAMAVGVGCLRIIIAAPCCLAIFVPYARRWWPGRPNRTPDVPLESRDAGGRRTAATS